jgi:hypothetical protein
MATNGSGETTTTGRVVAVNDKGIRFEYSDAWANYSKFAVGLVAPAKGDLVTVTFDRQGFIRSCTPVNGSDINSAPHGAQSATSARDTTITRLAVLKAAAEFGASRQDLKSGDVLAIAASWERWVTREEE